MATPPSPPIGFESEIAPYIYDKKIAAKQRRLMKDYHITECHHCHDYKCFIEMKWFNGWSCPKCYAIMEDLNEQLRQKYDFDNDQTIDDATSKITRDKYYQYKFVTFTLNKENVNKSHDDCMSKIKAIRNSKAVPVAGYYGCLELTQAGVKHYHVLFDIPKTPQVTKRGFNSSHLKNFWKYGNIDIQPVQVPLSQNLERIISYIEKTDLKENLFGIKRHFLCHSTKDVDPDLVDQKDDKPDVVNFHTVNAGETKMHN